jgi:short-subunit dehydrogenase involved in D-alanine esterification of teichoic acids
MQECRELRVEDSDLEKADQEICIKIRGPMHLAIGFLPHFKSKKAATIINVSSTLAFIPISIINPIYNGAKVWLHFFTMNLRTQLENGEGSKGIKVAETREDNS